MKKLTVSLVMMALIAVIGAGCTPRQPQGGTGEMQQAPMTQQQQQEQQQQQQQPAGEQPAGQ